MARNRRRPVGFSHIDYYQGKERDIQAAINELAQKGEQILMAEAGPQMMSANPQVTNSRLQATIAPQTPLNRFEPYLRGLEADPQSMEPGLSNTGLRPTIAPATPREKFQPLLNEVARLNSGRRAAGIPEKIIDPVEGLIKPGSKDQWYTLTGGAPAAVDVKSGNNSERIFMDHERNNRNIAQYNPITGRLEAIPFIDPSNAGQPLVLKKGIRDKSELGTHDIASEYVTEHALKLMGMTARLNNQDQAIGWNGQLRFDRQGKPMMKHWQSDFIDSQSGQLIDSEVRHSDGKTSGKLPVQMYTDVNMNQVLGNKSAGESLELIVDEVVKRYDLSHDEAIQYLMGNINIEEGGMNRNSPIIGQSFKDGIGKMLKNQARGLVERSDQMDSIIMPGYPAKTAHQMLKYDKDVRFGRGTELNVQLPDTMHLISTELADRFMLDNAQSMIGQTQARGNDGFKENRSRLRFYANLPMNAAVDNELVSIDITKAYPLTQQLLNVQPINRNR